MALPKAVQFLKALADPTRLRIVLLLADRDELCVCEIVDALHLPQYSISRHLALLRSAGLVAGWRQGKWMHYSLAPNLSRANRDLVKAICTHAAATSSVREDRRRRQRHLRPRLNGKIVECCL